ncbi:helix-turn-helix transcriptional regulator [soil metagenome]
MGLNPTAGTLLGFLLEQPRTGWQLIVDIEASVGNFWNVTRSQVYRELPRLAEAGLVRAGAVGDREQRPYRITAKGRTAFRRWLAEGPPAETRRSPLLLTTFFGEHLRDEDFAAMLDEQDRRAAMTLDRYEMIEQLPMDRYQAATLRFGIEYTRLVRRWIAETARPLVDENGP